MPSEPRIVVIAGRNGAGKTTFAGEHLPGGRRAHRVRQCRSDRRSHFAHVAGQRCGQGAPTDDRGDRAPCPGRAELRFRDNAGRSRLASPDPALASSCRRRDLVDHPSGYRVELIFLSLKSPEQALRRVRQRVSQGRHDVAERIVRRRFDRGWRNFRSVYSGLVSVWRLVGSSGSAPVLIEGRATAEGARREPRAGHFGVDVGRSARAGDDEVPLSCGAAGSPDRLREGTGVVVWKDGKVVDIDPDPDMHEPLLRSEGQRVSPRLPPGFRRHPPTDP